MSKLYVNVSKPDRREVDKQQRQRDHAKAVLAGVVFTKDRKADYKETYVWGWRHGMTVTSGYKTRHEAVAVALYHLEKM